MITPTEALQAQEWLFKRALDVVKVKRVDYSGEADPFANFRQSQFWGVEAWRGAAIRMMDKLSRISQLTRNDGQGAVKDESLEDTFIDLLNYAVIVYLLWLEQNGKREVIDKLVGKTPEPPVAWHSIRYDS